VNEYLETLAECLREHALDRDHAAHDDMVELRNAYTQAYHQATGMGSVSIGDLLAAQRGVSPVVLQQAQRAGFGDGNLLQCIDRVGKVATYASLTGHGVPIEIDGCLVEGLTTPEVISGVRSAMPRLGDKKLATPKAGDLTKRLVEALYDVSVASGDCGSTDRISVDHLSRRARRRQVEASGLRSPMTCSWLAKDNTMVCAGCYGDDIRTGRPVSPGTRVGVIASQALGERGTQLALKSIHAGTSAADLPALHRILGSSPRSDAGRFEGHGLFPQAGGSARLADDPLAAFHLLRRIYTFDGDPTSSDSIPAVDDIHLELVVASLATAQRAHPDASPLNAAMQLQDPLVRATVRGALKPIIDAATNQLSTSTRSFRTHFVLNGSGSGQGPTEQGGDR
jgi:hypothetical protein